MKDGTTDFATGIGTGPLQAARNSSPAFARSSCATRSYWKPGKPYLDEIEFVGIGDESARVNALLSGGMDLVNAVNPRSVARVNRHARLRDPRDEVRPLLRPDHAPRPGPGQPIPISRWAMKYLLDREQMKKTIALDFATIGNDQPVDPTNRFYFAGLPQRTFDLDKAKFHLKKSGVTGKVPGFARRRQPIRWRWRC